MPPASTAWQPPDSDQEVKQWSPPESDEVVNQDDLRAQLMASKLVPDATTLGELPSVLFTPSAETRARAAQQVATKTPERVDALGADAGPIIPPTSRQDIGTLTGLNPASREAGAISSVVTTPGAIANSFATPEGALMIADPAAGAAFVAQMATSVPAKIGQAAGAYSAGDKESGDENLIQGLITAGMLALPAIHALKSGKPLDEVLGPDQANQLRQSVQQHETSTQGQETPSAQVQGNAATPAAEPPANVPAPSGAGTDASVPDGNVAQPELQPAIKYNGKVLTGGGNGHIGVVMSHAEDFPNLPSDFMGAANAMSGFVDKDGNFYDRNQAAKLLGSETPMTSEDLPNFDPNAAPAEKQVLPLKVQKTSGEEIGKQIGAKFDGEFDLGTGPIKQFTYAGDNFEGDENTPHYGTTFQMPADATLEQAKAKAQEVKDRFSNQGSYSLKSEGGKFHILNPKGKIEESFTDPNEAIKALGEYNTPSPEVRAPEKSPGTGLPKVNTKNGPVAEAKTPAQSPAAVKNEPTVVSAIRNDNRITIEVDANGHVPTVEELNNRFRNLGHNVEFQRVESPVASGRKVVRFRGTAVDQSGAYSSNAAKKAFRDAFGQDEDFRGKVANQSKEVAEKPQLNNTESGAGQTRPTQVVGQIPDAPNPPKLIGMGGAVPSEFARGQGNPTAMKYKLIDQERQQRGEPPLAKPESVSDQQVMDKAMAEVDKNPELPNQLVDELNKKPRSIDAWERMVLLLHKIDLRDQYEKSAREAAQAFDDSKDFPNRADDMRAANIRTAAISDKLNELESASRLSGSEQGRGLRALQIMANEDYSLAGLEMRARASKGGQPLTDAERANLTKIADEYKKANEALTQHLADARAKNSELEATKAINDIKKSEAPVDPHVKIIADRISDYFGKRADNALKFLSGKTFSYEAALPHLVDLGVSTILKGAADFTSWSAKMISLTHASLEPHLKDLWDKTNKKLDDHIKGEAGTPETKAKFKKSIKSMTPEEQKAHFNAQIAAKLKAGKKDAITSQVQKLARLFVREGITDRDALIDAVHNELKKSDPNITRRDTMDAISGYGDFKQLTKDEVSVKLRDLKGQMQQVGKLEDIQAKKPPLKTGVERRAPSDEERRLIKVVNEAKRQHGVVVTDPATQLKSALEARKTFYKNQIADLQKQIDAKEKFVKSKSRSPTDPELEALKKKRDEVKSEFDKTFHDQAAKDAAELKAVKDRIQNRIDEMQEKIQSGDFTKKTRKTPPVDREVQELTAKKEQVAKKFKKMQRDFENAQLKRSSKALDFVSNVRRFAVLSGVNVLGKLAAYSATKLPTIAATEAIGGALSKIPGLRQIAEKAPSEGGISLRALATATAKGLTQGFVDAKKTILQGHSDLRTAFGSRPESGREWYNWFQTVHEAIKSPLRRATFELSLAKRMEYAAAHGADITDPIVQLGLSKDAYLDSDRALLLENNRLANGIRVLFRNLEAKNKKTGQSPLGGKVAATLGRVEFPILSVPLNYVKQSLVAAFGLVSGSIKARAAFKNGIENLDPKEADEILRHLKYGTIGGAALLLGFYDGYKNGANGSLGGFYQPGEKRKDNQAPAGGARVAGHNLPSVLFHNPVIAVAQLGHTMGAILASKLNKHTDQTHSVPVAAVTSMMGLLNQSPLGPTTELVTQLGDPRSAEYALGEHAKGLLVPQLVQEIANVSDRNAQGKTIKRNPQTIPQHIESGIPGLRQTLPVKRK